MLSKKHRIERFSDIHISIQTWAAIYNISFESLLPINSLLHFSLIVILQIQAGHSDINLSVQSVQLKNITTIKKQNPWHRNAYGRYGRFLYAAYGIIYCSIFIPHWCAFAPPPQ